MASKTKRIIFIIIFTIIIISAIVIILIPKSKYSDTQVKINNLEEISKNYPKNPEKIDFITHALYSTIDYNTNINPKDVKDINIRNDTYVQIDNPRLGTHEVSYIVDIPSLEQSYQLHYIWADQDNNNESGSGDYTDYASCLQDESLAIYPDFNCQDMFSIAAGTNDRVIYFLPYFDPLDRFSASYLIDSSNRLTINVSINDCSNQELSSIYKTVADTWLKENNITTDNYIIKYTFCNTSN
ncbi:hypothetical protein IJH74_00685 [Candidatus Saccharibacteria bacterium]|nr:hypothetical protein [Candidatus Saccharibacteria bacterium]